MVNWEIIGATGEWAGAIAVVVTLFYLARQIRQNTAATQATTELEIMGAWNQLSYFRAESTEVIDLYGRGRAGLEHLREDEVGRFEHLCYSQFNIYQVMFNQHRRGLLSDDIWKAHNHNLGLAVRSPGIRAWLENTRLAYPEAFRTHLDHLLDQPIKDAGD